MNFGTNWKALLLQAKLKRGWFSTALPAAASLVALTGVFGLVLYAFVSSSGVAQSINQTAVALAASVYFGTIWLLSRLGVTRLSELQELTHSDSLTGMPNRRAFHAILQTPEYANQEVAVAMIEFDGFRQLNDHHNHMIAQDVLKTCAKMLEEICGDEAVAFRLGGEEFAIARKGTLSGSIIESICRAIVDRLVSPVQVGDRRFTIGASIGLSRCVSTHEVPSSELLRQADVAMYASKRAGRMRCTWFSEELDRSREAADALNTELRAAISNEEFTLHYQPLVDAKSGDIVAVEALVRWDRKQGDPIGPHIFIPVAEESGLINPIGLWVIRQACLDALEWDGIKLSINISAIQLRNPEFPFQLGQILEETGLPPERLEIEITETSLVLEPVLAERSMAIIRGFGVDVALDDFGTGYASIGFLRQFRFEKLKLDRSLITEAGDDEGSRAMMLSSITVARAMKMGVTAEGVETESQADMVRAAGCDQIQGWLYYKAMPADEISALLVKQQSGEEGPPRMTKRKSA